MRKITPLAAIGAVIAFLSFTQVVWASCVPAYGGGTICSTETGGGDTNGGSAGSSGSSYNDGNSGSSGSSYNNGNSGGSGTATR